MNPLEIKKRSIIKETITPFLKNNGFTQKGVKYFKDTQYCKIEAEIQSQRYYTKDDMKNFRINVSLSYNEGFPELYDKYLPYPLYCGWFCIQGENSWISINQNTDIAELNIWLKNKLKELSEYLDEFNDIEKIINKAKISTDNNDNGLFYAFLLRENKKEKELELLKQGIKKQIETLEDELKKLHNEKDILEGKEESLDKKIRLKGIKMMMNEKINKLKGKNAVLNEIEE